MLQILTFSGKRLGDAEIRRSVDSIPIHRACASDGLGGFVSCRRNFARAEYRSSGNVPLGQHDATARSIFFPRHGGSGSRAPARETKGALDAGGPHPLAALGTSPVNGGRKNSVTGANVALRGNAAVGNIVAVASFPDRAIVRRRDRSFPDEGFAP